MKIQCKCGKFLTKDLRPVKKYICKDAFETFQDQDGVDIVEKRKKYIFPSGGFMIQRKDKFSWTEKDSGIKGYHSVIHTPERLIVYKDDILDNIIPKFISGYGCCNWSFGYKLKCECGNKVAEMYLDCYESGVIKFIPKKTVRFYS
jgi:hypothetical protein